MLPLVVLLAIAGPHPSWSQSSKAPAAEMAPVVLDGEPLFELQAGFDSVSPVERARGLVTRLEQIAQDDSIRLQDLTVKQRSDRTEIGVKEGQIIMTIRPEDVQATGQPHPTLARRYLRQIKFGIRQYRLARSSTLRLWRIFYTVLFTIGVLIFFRMGPVFPKVIYPRIHAWRERSLAASEAESSEPPPWVEIADLLLVLARIVRVVLIFGLLYLYLLWILNLFSGTRPLGLQLAQELWQALTETGTGIIAYLPNLLRILLFIGIGNFVLRFLKVAFKAVERRAVAMPGFYPEWAQPTHHLTRLLIFGITAVVVVPYLPGYGSGVFQALSLFAGVLVSLGSAGAINSIISGMILIYTRGFQVGDRVKIGDTAGEVIEVTLLVTRIKTIKNERITIPNSTIIGSSILNFSALCRDGTPLMLHTTITLGYDVPWTQVNAALIEAAQSTPGILTDPSPFVWQTRLEDHYVSYELNAYTDRPETMFATYAHLHQQIQDHCNVAGIEILSPHYAAVRDGNHSTIPQDYLQADYHPPGFRLSPLTQWLNPLERGPRSSDKQD